MSQLEEQILKQNVLEEHRKVHELQLRVKELRADVERYVAINAQLLEDLTKLEEVVEAGSYERQFREMVQLWGPVDAYARAHPKMKLGESVAKFTLGRLQELDSRPQVIPDTPQAFDDLAYQILALALNNGTREAFPGKLKKLLEEPSNAQANTD